MWNEQMKSDIPKIHVFVVDDHPIVRDGTLCVPRKIEYVEDHRWRKSLIRLARRRAWDARPLQ